MKIHHDNPDRLKFRIYGLLWDKKFRTKFNKDLKNKPLPILMTYGISNSISVEGYLQFSQHKDTIIAKYFVENCVWIYSRRYNNIKMVVRKGDVNTRSVASNVKNTLRKEIIAITQLLGAEQWGISTIHFYWK